MQKRIKEDKWKGGKGERKKRRKEEKKKSPEYYEQYPGDHRRMEARKRL